MLNQDRRDTLGSLLSLLSSLCLYLSTISPTVQGFDSAELTVGAYDLGFVHSPGYPLYLLVGHLFIKLPVGDVGFRMNLLSAILASLGVYFLYKLIFRQTSNYWASTLSTAILITSPAFWSQAIRAEVYTLHVFLMTAALYFWCHASETGDRRSFLICYLLIGLSSGNHPTTILLWISTLVASIGLESRQRKTIILGNILAIILACAIYLYFPLRSLASLRVDYIRPYFGADPSNLKGLWWLVSGKAFHCLLLPQGNGASLWEEVSRLGNFLWGGMLGFGMIFAIPGWYLLHRSRRDWNRLLTLYFVLNLFMFLSYRAIDKEVMFLPVFVLLCIWMGCGFVVFTKWIGSLFKDPQLRLVETLVGSALAIIIIAGLITDWRSISLRSDRRAYEYSKRLLGVVEPSTIIVNHWATASVIDYLKIVEGLRPDVTSFNVDFYFLGLQHNCEFISNQDLLESGWIYWLESQSMQDRLCVIEPLHGLPDGYSWQNDGLCNILVAEDKHQ